MFQCLKHGWTSAKEPCIACHPPKWSPQYAKRKKMVTDLFDCACIDDNPRNRLLLQAAEEEIDSLLRQGDTHDP